MRGFVPSAWRDHLPLEVEVCCPNFLEATENGTDNEGYGALIRPWERKWKIGSDRPPMLYCPWCGAVLVAPPADNPPERSLKEDKPMKVIPVGTPSSFEGFLERERLEVEVRERPKDLKLPRFYATIRGVEIIGAGVLISAMANGESPEEAQAEYAKALEGKRVRIAGVAPHPDRRIQLPNEWEASE